MKTGPEIKGIDHPMRNISCGSMCKSGKILTDEKAKEVARLLVSEESMAEHFHGLAPKKHAVCWNLNFNGSRRMEPWARASQEHIGGRVFGSTRPKNRMGTARHKDVERWKPGIVYLVNGEEIRTEKELLKTVAERKETRLRF